MCVVALDIAHYCDSFSLGLISAMSTHILRSNIASQVSSQQPYVLYDHSTASIQKLI